MLKAAHCKVNEIRKDQRPSYLTSSIHRSTAPRSNRRPSQSHFADQHRDDGQPLKGEPRATALTTLANMTRKSTRMSERTSTISETRDGVSTSAGLVALKKKYATVKSTSRSSVTQTQLSSHLTPAMLQITAPTNPKGPQHS